MKKVTAIIGFLLTGITLSFAQETDFQSTSGQFPDTGVDVAGYSFHHREALIQNVISGVPAYNWYRGCGPTALGMVLAYYDANGFPDLFPGNAATLTTAVKNAIASDEHYSDYSLPLDYNPALIPDKSELPLGDEHTDNCIADFMQTSQSIRSNYWGWSWSSDICHAFNDYISHFSSYGGICNSFSYNNFSWAVLKNEINNNHPMMMLVDTDGDNATDHFITVVGYKEESGVNYYGCYHTWDQNLHWYEYRSKMNGNTWGVSSLFTFLITAGAGIQESIPDNPMYAWPQPFTDYFYLKLPQNISGKCLFEIMDISGKLVYYEEVDANIPDGIYSPDMENIKFGTGGLYLLRLISPSAVFHLRIFRIL